MCEHKPVVFPIRIMSHSRNATSIAEQHGWLPGARYTNMRDVRKCNRIGLVDVDWRKYDYERHLSTVKDVRPLLTVARDIENKRDFGRTIKEAEKLAQYAKFVIIVPKVKGIVRRLRNIVGSKFIVGYSVPTTYGETTVSVNEFEDMPIHLLGGRPDVQRRLGDTVNVVSLDSNRLTLDAKYGDYFDGETFRPHPVGGLDLCIEDSIKKVNFIWNDYEPLINSSVRRKIKKWIARNKKTS